MHVRSIALYRRGSDATFSLSGVEPGRHETLATDCEEDDLRMRMRADVSPPVFRSPSRRLPAEGSIVEIPFRGICGDVPLSGREFAGL